MLLGHKEILAGINKNDIGQVLLDGVPIPFSESVKKFGGHGRPSVIWGFMHCSIDSTDAAESGYPYGRDVL